METCYLYVFNSFYNTYAYLCDLKKLFDDLCSRWYYFSLLCFCFKNLDLIDRQTTQFDFSRSILFVIFISCGSKLLVFTPQTIRYSTFLPVFISSNFDCVFFMSYIIGSIFSATHFKHFDFIEWFNLNSNPKSLFEISLSFAFNNVSTYSIKFFIIIEIHIIRINSNPAFLDIFVFSFHNLDLCQHVLFHQSLLPTCVF